MTPNSHIILAHPSKESTAYQIATSARTVLDKRVPGTAIIIDLYEVKFDPVLSRDEYRNYDNVDDLVEPVSELVSTIRQSETLVFIFPVWMYGVPSIMKGFLRKFGALR